MQSVGTQLKQARKKKGLSLDEINVRTRINSKNLAALEGDDVSEISSPFFYRSFVKQYAEQVDLDFQTLAAAVEIVAGNMPQPELPGRSKYKPARMTPIQVRPKRDLGWVAFAAFFLGVVVIGSGAYGGWKYYAPLMHRATLLTTAAPTQKSTDLPESVGPVRQEPMAALVKRQPKAVRRPVLPVVESNAAVTPANPVESIHLELAATEPTWLSVSADGKQAYTGTLEPTQIKILDGLQFAKLRTGNAGGVSITFNGKEIGPIGPRGRTRTVVFTKTGYAVQRSEPALVPADHIGG